MCGGEKYFSAIPYPTYDPSRKLQWYWTYLDLLVAAITIEKYLFVNKNLFFESQSTLS